MQEDHANDVVTRSVHAAEVHERVNGGSEGTVQPTTTLTNELSSTFRYVSLTLGGLDVCEMPFAACLGDQLETQNTILGQEHVLLENVHAFDTLGTKLLRQGVVTVEVLLERTSHDCAETISREGTRQHRDITKGRFQGLVENI